MLWVAFCVYMFFVQVHGGQRSTGALNHIPLLLFGSNIEFGVLQTGS